MPIQNNDPIKCIRRELQVVIAFWHASPHGLPNRLSNTSATVAVTGFGSSGVRCDGSARVGVLCTRNPPLTVSRDALEAGPRGCLRSVVQSASWPTRRVWADRSCTYSSQPVLRHILECAGSWRCGICGRRTELMNQSLCARTLSTPRAVGACSAASCLCGLCLTPVYKNEQQDHAYHYASEGHFRSQGITLISASCADLQSITKYIKDVEYKKENSLRDKEQHCGFRPASEYLHYAPAQEDGESSTCPYLPRIRAHRGKISREYGILAANVSL